MFRVPDFSVVVWLRKTAAFATLKAELLDAAVVQPYESTEYQGMVDFHFSAANLSETKRLADALKAQQPVKSLTSNCPAPGAHSIRETSCAILFA
jgi:hypothetical protein